MREESGPHEELGINRESRQDERLEEESNPYALPHVVCHTIDPVARIKKRRPQTFPRGRRRSKGAWQVHAGCPSRAFLVGL